MDLEGTPSDDDGAILATGRSGVTTIFASMSSRHPEGADAAYLAWHSLDHRPEQYRLAALRSSVRLVSTPSCRAARAMSDPSLDATDHVMTYFFADAGDLAGFKTRAEIEIGARGTDDGGAGVLRDHQAAERCL